MQQPVVSRRDLLLLPGLAVLAPLAFADLYDDYLNSKSRSPFVAFLARGGFPGHAFVGIGVTIDSGLRVFERFYGYYPAAEDKVASIKLVFGQGSGALDYKWKDTSWEQDYIVPLDPDRKAAVLAVLDQWKANDPKYNLFALGGKNCSSLAAEVAKAAGLKVPGGAGSMLPLDYMKKLEAANR